MELKQLQVRGQIQAGLGKGALSAVVEGFFAKLSKRHLKRGIFHSVVALSMLVDIFLAEHNHQANFHIDRGPRQIAAANAGTMR